MRLGNNGTEDLEQRVAALETSNKELRDAVEMLVAVLGSVWPISGHMRTSMGDKMPALVPFTRDPYTGKVPVHAGRQSQET